MGGIVTPHLISLFRALTVSSVIIHKAWMSDSVFLFQGVGVESG